MKRVFVSGCYDIIHAGHIQFFREAKALGDFLIVSFASEEVLWNHKKRKPSIPDKHKKAILEELKVVDQVVIGNNTEMGLDFKDSFLLLKPDILAVTEDDQYSVEKKELCKQVGAEYIILPKTPPSYEPVSTSQIVKWIKAPQESPLRIDLAGGWLDVPKYSRNDAFVVNCAITPKVSLHSWEYERNAGLGGSGAWAILNGNTGIEEELALGTGWQDPAVIRETGLCVWRSGEKPSLEFKSDGVILKGRMAIRWCDKSHDTPSIAKNKRNYDLIADASRVARYGVIYNNFELLLQGVEQSYKAQLQEGMDILPDEGEEAKKYCGGGFGGYALYIFGTQWKRDKAVTKKKFFKAIEPYSSWE